MTSVRSRISRRALGRLALVGLLALSPVACAGDDAASGSDSDSSTTGEPGECLQAIVFDIDETLTISNEEWEMQKADGTYDPIAREAATALVQAYADRGYYIVYLTARSKTWVLGGTGETAPDATHRWLVEHDFPIDDGRSRLIMSDMVVPGDAAQVYKAAALMDMQGEGLSFQAAYGNAVTDIGAFAEAMIGKDVTFIIGVHAGEEGTVAIEGESWKPHLESYVPTVMTACAG
ncbi:MAG: hypothetical protein R3A79_18055 [Nannocystaceae bacterium]